VCQFTFYRTPRVFKLTVEQSIKISLYPCPWLAFPPEQQPGACPKAAARNQLPNRQRQYDADTTDHTVWHDGGAPDIAPALLFYKPTGYCHQRAPGDFQRAMPFDQTDDFKHFSAIPDVPGIPERLGQGCTSRSEISRKVGSLPKTAKRPSFCPNRLVLTITQVQRFTVLETQETGVQETHETGNTGARRSGKNSET
jgi:hypothetical protein